ILFIGAWTAIFVLAKGRHWVLKIRLLQPLHSKLTRLLSAFDALLAAPRILLAVVVTSVTAWIFALAILYTLLLVTGAGLDLPTVVSLWPLAVFVGVLPLTLAGMGTRDAAFLYLLLAVVGEVDRGAVIAATIGYSLIGAWVFGIVGIPFTIRLFLRGGGPSSDEPTT
ncbi:MAG: lysylphosphatidylglycerol synthase domain-containing protein, partial [Nannocystaceae bacterium]